MDMDLPDEVSIMTLPNAILFPQALLPLYIFEPRYRAMLKDSLENQRMFAVALPNTSTSPTGGTPGSTSLSQATIIRSRP